MTAERGTSLSHERHVRDGITALYCPWCGTWPPMDPDPRYHAPVAEPLDDRITPSLRPWVLGIGVAMAVALWWLVTR